MKLLKKVPLIPLILGALLVIFGIVLVTVPSVQAETYKVVGHLVIGVSLIAYSALVVFPLIARKSSSIASTLRIIEFIILIAAAIIGFILPAFGVQVQNIGGGSRWIGIGLILTGSVELFLGAHGKARVKGLLFFACLIAVILGTWIYTTNFVDKSIEIVTLTALFGGGLLLLVIGLLNLKTKNR